MEGKTWHWLSLWAHNCRFWAISETPCLFNLKSSLQWKFLPLEILVNLIAIEMHKWNDKSCILSAITAIFFYLLESDLCCIDELHFFKVYFPISSQVVYKMIGIKCCVVLGLTLRILYCIFTRALLERGIHIAPSILSYSMISTCQALTRNHWYFRISKNNP